MAGIGRSAIAAARLAWSNPIVFVPALIGLLIECVRAGTYRLTVSCLPVLGVSLYGCEKSFLVVPSLPVPGFPASVGVDRRLLWFGVAVILGVVAATIIASGFILVVRSVRGVGARETRAAVLVVIGVAAVSSFVKAQAILPVEHLLGADGPFAAPLAAFLRTISSTIRAATFAAVASLVAAACTTLRTDITESAEHSEAFLRLQIERLQVVLYAGAALLVLAVLEFQMFFDWLLTAIPNPERITLAAVIAAATGSNGAIYTVFLAALYVPASLILRARCHALSHAIVPSLDIQGRDEWLEKRGLAPTWPRTATRALVVLAPYLAGSPLSALIKLTSS
jgi:hypothetical protein